MSQLQDAFSLIGRPDLWAAADIPLLPCAQGVSDLANYINLLLKWNKAINLSGCSDALSLLRDLVQDSFFLASMLDRLLPDACLRPAIWDLGAGAGLPGVPLRIVWQRGDYTWVEASRKRALFLQTTQALLKLKAFHGYAGRAEDFFKVSREANCIISRAFKPWRQLLSFCAPKIAENGYLIVMANGPAPDLPHGWRIASCMEYMLPGRKRWLWAIAREA